MTDDVEHRLSMRLSEETLAQIEQHQERMKKRTGASFTRTQAVTSLVEAGGMAWGASVKAGALSPAALLGWASDNFGKGGDQ
jgi:hypothetical protein